MVVSEEEREQGAEIFLKEITIAEQNKEKRIKRIEDSLRDTYGTTSSTLILTL